MIAVKGNKEIKILEMQKENYLEKGYTILDKDLKVIASPSTKEEKIRQLEEENKELRTKLANKGKKDKTE
jgi:hypothetical protein